MPQQAVTVPARARLAGIVADGGFKVLLGAAFTVGASGLGGLLGVPAWLMVVSGVALLLGGAIELRCVRSRPVATYMRLMVAYDGGWALATLAGLLLAWRGSAAGGEVWITYQAVAVIAFVALLLAATPVQPASA